LLENLQQIPDPRGRQGRRHSLAAMLATVVCAVLSGARGFTAIAQWLAARRLEELHQLGFTRTPPTANAFRDLLIALDPDTFEATIQQWTAACLKSEHANSTDSASPAELEPIALDGKTLCGTIQRHRRTVQLLSLFAHRSGLTLGQTPVPDGTNEPGAAIPWLRSLVLKGKLITADAIYCQRDVCRQILDSGGHYFIAVKDNQPTLLADIAAEFQAAFSPGDRKTTLGASGSR
jgi:hypothetical protein